MERNTKTMFVVITVASGLALAKLGAGAMPPDRPNQASKEDRAGAKAADPDLPSVDEARARARLLHDTIHTTLHVVHRQYYREDEGLTIPAATLKSVFRQLEEQRKVELHWLVVDAQAMNVDHNPQDEFERNAVKAFRTGKEEYELAGNGVYRHAGVITLTSECLKCHLPSRTSTKDRAAGLVITMPTEKK